MREFILAIRRALTREGYKGYKRSTVRLAFDQAKEEGLDKERQKSLVDYARKLAKQEGGTQ